MSDNYKSQKFVEWLDKLQQESWQLELIISGFSIFGLLSVFGPIKEYLTEAQSYDKQYMMIFWMIVIISCVILTFNLIFHVVLRGLWIGALGLRYVSGEIDYEALNYSPKFTSYLKRKIGSFDKFISRLEDYCSILFALTFLMVFYFISMCLIFIFVSFIFYFINKLEPIWPVGRDVVAIVVFVFVIASFLLLLIDFAGQGILKKRKWTSALYFPFYWFYNYIGLSFLYRPLVYNFLDNKFGRRIMLLLLPLYIILLGVISAYYKEANFFSVDERTSETFINSNTYEDLLDEKEYIVIASISSKIITTDYMKVFLDFKDEMDDLVFAFDENLKPTKDSRGLNTNITFGKSNILPKAQRDSISTLYLEVFNDIYKIKIDNVEYDKEFILSHNKKKQLGFETYIQLDSLTKGKHILKIERLIKPKSDSLEHLISIPFWYFEPSQ